MAEIINLRMARKRKRRDDKEQQSAANRAKFGRTRAEKQRTELESARERTSLDGSKIERDDPTSR
jgi:hypothetical protein